MLKGNVERVTAREITGWAQDGTAPVSLLVTVDDALAGRVMANRYRADLETAGIGRGRHGFSFEFAPALSPAARHVIHVRREGDGADLPGSPCLLEAARRFDAGVEAEIARLLALCDAAEDLPRKIAFVAAELERLVQGLADRDSSRMAREHYGDLLRRWRERRGAAEAADPPPAPAPRALVIEDRLSQADALPAHLCELQQRGFAITLVPAGDFAPEAAAVAALERLGVACGCAPFYGSVEEILRRQAGTFDVVLLRGEAASAYGPLVRRYCPRASVG